MELMNTRQVKWESGKATGLASRCDCIIINEKKIIYNKPLTDIKTIFINTRINVRRKSNFGFKMCVKLLNKIKNNVVLIIAGADWTFPNSTDKRMPPVTKRAKNIYLNLVKSKKISHLFVENLDENIGPKVSPIPLGVNPHVSPVNLNYFLQFENTDMMRPFKMTNFNRIRDGKGQWAERARVQELCETEWSSLYIKHINMDYPDYLKKLSEYPFTLCVHGGGLDPCPKVFEAIAVKTIPIIKRSLISDVFQNLPVAIVEEWTGESITSKKLKKWYDDYSPYFYNELRHETKKKLTLDYWWDIIIGKLKTECSEQ